LAVNVQELLDVSTLQGSDN